MSQKIALIIGNSEYQDANLARLVTPHEDVNDLSEVLRSPDVGSFDQVITLVNESDATIRLSIEDFFADKKPDDLLVLYFSGHGVRDEQGRLFLAVNNTRAHRLRATAIPAEFITSEMDRSRSKRQVLILDCCHSGAFAQGTNAITGASAGVGPAFEGSGYGRVVLTATDATQYAWEGDQIIGEAENSVFTHYLIEGLKTGKADADGDGRITVSEMYDYVYEQVVTTHPKQTPGKWSYKQQGDIVIARNPHLPAVQAAELSIELRQAIESPLANVREGAVRELAPLLRGSNAGLALAAREALQHLSEDDSRRVSIAATEALKAAPSAPAVEAPPTPAPAAEPAPPAKPEPAPAGAAPRPTGLVGKTIGRYQLVELLGRGGMAEVYRAYQPAFDRYVALKLIHAFIPQDPDFFARFQHEARLAAALNHPNLTPLYDFDQADGLYYLVSKFIRGETLAGKLQHDVIAFDAAIRIVCAVGEALDYAHARGAVHRDVTPGNIMIEPDGQVWLTDLGLARMLSAGNMTAAGAMVGTPAYLAPEQGRGEPGDAQSDIYSLGVILYELVTGRRPYEADTPFAVIIKHVSEPLPLPRSINPALSEAVERVLLRALAKNPADRFATAGDMVKALRAASGQAVAQERVLDAAIARSVPVNQPADLLVQIRRSGSRGLRAVIEVDDSYSAAPEDVKSKPIEIEFPRDAGGQAQPAELILEVNAPDFEPQKQRKHIAVPPKKDSEVYTFLVTPLRTGNLVLTLDVYRGDINVASRLIRTTGVPSDQSAAEPKYLVSLPLRVTSALIPVFPSSIPAPVAALPYAPTAEAAGAPAMSRPATPAPSATSRERGVPVASAPARLTSMDRQRTALLAGVTVSIGWFAGWLLGIIIGSLFNTFGSASVSLTLSWIASGVITGIVLRQVTHSVWWSILSLGVGWLLCLGAGLSLGNQGGAWLALAVAVTWLINSLTAMLSVRNHIWLIAVLTTAAAGIAFWIAGNVWQLAALKFDDYGWPLATFFSEEPYSVLDLLIGPAITTVAAGSLLTFLLYRRAEPGKP